MRRNWPRNSRAHLECAGGMNPPADRIIVSGLSGSGKSVALQSLEDIGYYCIDNLPSVLLPEFSRHLTDDNTFAVAAVGIDSRNRHFLRSLNDKLKQLESRENFLWRVLFLQADESALLRRFGETRRKHPLTDARTPLIDGIRQERALLQPLLDRAEKIIDTTDTTPHELRGLIRDFAAGGAAELPLFFIESFGFKFGAPRDADFVFDVRCLPNPYWRESLRALNGLDAPVREYLDAQAQVGMMVEEVHRFLQIWLPGFAEQNRSYFTVAIGCTGGRHRSVFVAEKLRARFAGDAINVRVRHRELDSQQR